MPHSDLKKAIRIIARGFEVSYQRAQTRIQKAIAQGTITTIAVVRNKVDQDTWLAIGFTVVWRTSSRARRAGIGGVEISASPGSPYIAVRDSANPNGLPLLFPRDRPDLLIDNFGPSPELLIEPWPGPAYTESKPIDRADQDDSPTGGGSDAA